MSSLRIALFARFGVPVAVRPIARTYPVFLHQFNRRFMLVLARADFLHRFEIQLAIWRPTALFVSVRTGKPRAISIACQADSRAAFHGREEAHREQRSSAHSNPTMDANSLTGVQLMDKFDH